MIKTIPPCFFPTTVVFLDDQKEFLNNIQMKIDFSKGNFLFFDDVPKTLTYINSVKETPYINRCIRKKDADEFDHRLLDISFPAIHHEIYNAQRFEQISTLVVDYDMPTMTGLEVCRHLQSTTIKKILLTGMVGERMVIDAFNEGIIDGYIKKQDLGIYEKINKAVIQSQWDFFVKLSRPIIHALEVNNNQLNILQDRNFIQYFENFLSTYNIKEFYLLDDQGSFLGVSPQGLMNLFVATEEKIEGVYQLSRQEDVSLEVSKALKKREQMVFSPYPEEQYYPEESEWSNYLYPVEKIKGTQGQIYYCAIVPSQMIENQEKMHFFTTK